MQCCVLPSQEVRILLAVYSAAHDKWVPVTMAWHVLRLWMRERPPIWRVTGNILNKRSQTADKGWSSSWWVRC